MKALLLIAQGNITAEEIMKGVKNLQKNNSTGCYICTICCQEPKKIKSELTTKYDIGHHIYDILPISKTTQAITSGFNEIATIFEGTLTCYKQGLMV